MGNVCKRQATDTAVAQPRSVPTTSNGGQPNTTTTTLAPVNANSPENDDSSEELFYFDAMENPTESMLQYPPASIPNPHVRSSIAVDTSMLASKKPAMRRATVSVRNWLRNEPRVSNQLRGYPGELTEKELEQTLEFRKLLKSEDPAFMEMVDCFAPAEEEPYALCRFMRARNFDASQILDDELRESVPLWKAAKAHNFYPTPSAAVGCPASIFLTQYPSLYHGHAKNGCPVGYFMAGRMQVEGIECVTSPEQIQNYLWYSVMHQFKNIVAQSQKEKPDLVVRCEAVSIINLKGLGSSQLNSQTLSVLKNIVVVFRAFPELLNRMVITNAPYFFSLTWPVIKGFLDARTASKIEIFSKQRTANKRLAELIDSRELLADFGGTGPSFDTAVFEEGNDENAKRQEVHLIQVSANSANKWNFDLAGNEKANVTIYTRAYDGAVAILSTLKSKTQVAKVDVASPNAPENQEACDPYVVQVADNITGTDTFCISIQSKSTSATSYFLVAVKVFKK